MRILYVEKGGASASRNASCDLSAAETARAKSTRSLMMLTLALDRSAHEVGGGGLGLARSVSWRSGHAHLVCREGRHECLTQCLV